MEIGTDRNTELKLMLAMLVMMALGVCLATMAFWPDEALLALCVWTLRAGLFFFGFTTFFAALGFFVALLLRV